MSSSTGVFCDHKRLRTSCPECKPAPKPSAPKPAATRVSAPKPASSSSGARAESKEPKSDAGRSGGSKNMMPLRKRAKKPSTRVEAERAEAWWVHK